MTLQYLRGLLFFGRFWSLWQLWKVERALERTLLDTSASPFIAEQLNTRHIRLENKVCFGRNIQFNHYRLSEPNGWVKFFLLSSGIWRKTEQIKCNLAWEKSKFSLGAMLLLMLVAWLSLIFVYALLQSPSAVEFAAISAYIFTVVGIPGFVLVSLMTGPLWAYRRFNRMKKSL